jgi:hypothetical protein
MNQSLRILRWTGGALFWIGFVLSVLTAYNHLWPDHQLWPYRWDAL